MLHEKVPLCRSQGIGSAVVEALLDTLNKPTIVYLMTIEDRRFFYERFGFRIVEDESEVPVVLKMEKILGGPVAAMVANQGLIIMTLSQNTV